MSNETVTSAVCITAGSMRRKGDRWKRDRTQHNKLPGGSRALYYIHRVQQCYGGNTTLRKHRFGASAGRKVTGQPVKPGSPRKSPINNCVSAHTGYMCITTNVLIKYTISTLSNKNHSYVAVYDELCIILWLKSNKAVAANKAPNINTNDNRTTTIFTALFEDHPGEPVPEENFWTLWCKGRLTEADTPTIRLGATPSGLTSAHLHHPQFFTGRMPFLPLNKVSKHWRQKHGE